jgi:hypothetical protein
VRDAGDGLTGSSGSAEGLAQRCLGVRPRWLQRHGRKVLWRYRSLRTCRAAAPIFTGLVASDILNEGRWGAIAASMALVPP